MTEEYVLYIFILRRAPYGEGGPTYGTKFDLSMACDRCGTGAKQIGPLLLKNSEIPKKRDIVETLDDELLISQILRNKFENNKIKGVELRPVLNFRKKNSMGYWEIYPLHTLPKVSPDSIGISTENQCPKCKRDGHFDVLKQKKLYIYKEISNDFLQQADIFNTWEHFGNSNLIPDPPLPPSVYGFQKIVHFAKPRLIMSEKAKKMFESWKLRGVEFVPVTIKKIV